MPLIPLALPPGVHANGTPLQSAGRWRDSSLVRWANGTMGPVGGWADRVQIGTEPPRASLAWRALNGDHWFALATAPAVHAVTGTWRALGSAVANAGEYPASLFLRVT